MMKIILVNIFEFKKSVSVNCIFYVFMYGVL